MTRWTSALTLWVAVVQALPSQPPPSPVPVVEASPVPTAEATGVTHKPNSNLHEISHSYSREGLGNGVWKCQYKQKFFNEANINSTCVGGQVTTMPLSLCMATP